MKCPFELRGHRGERGLFAAITAHFSPKPYPDPDHFHSDRHAPVREESEQRGAFATCLGDAGGRRVP